VEGKAEKGLPFANELTPSELDNRREGLLPGLLALAQETVSITNGLYWRFAPSADSLTAVAKITERQCWLEVTGPMGTAEFLATIRGRTTTDDDDA